MDTFQCTCGRRLFFNNTVCIGCGSEVGWCEACRQVAPIVPVNGRFSCANPKCGAAIVKCHNYAVEAVCNRVFAVDPAAVLIHGKGGKLRRCPLWRRTVTELLSVVEGRPASQHVFLNRRHEPLTRYGIYALVERYAETAAKIAPSLKEKRVSPHVVRHTTATHLLRAGVDINTIRAWLGHVSLSTTNVYAEVDLEMKARALAKCEVESTTTRKLWRKDAALMEFLSQL